MLLVLAMMNVVRIRSRKSSTENEIARSSASSSMTWYMLTIAENIRVARLGNRVR